MHWKLWQSKQDAQWYWSLVARNGEIIASSEGYTSRAGALKGIRAVRIACLAPVKELA